MKQLTGLDATFLYMETDHSFGHVSSLSILERPSPDYDPYRAWYEQIEKRLHLLEPMTRKLRNVPLNLDHPFWIQDPGFDLNFHIRHTAIPSPGSREQLQNLVARIIARPLDRARPLWESYVIEGLPNNTFALLTKIHHATVDGAAGAQMMAMMLDASPDGDDVPPPDPNTPPVPPEPTDNEVLQAAMRSLARKPARFFVLSSRTLRALGQASNNELLTEAGNTLRRNLRGPIGRVLNFGRDLPEQQDVIEEAPATPAPKTPFNGMISPHRSFAYRSVSIDAIKAIKNEVGCTLNDVVMAVCAGGLRTYLERHDALPDEPLRASIPVSIRTGEEEERWTNRVSSIFAALPTDADNPFDRIQRVNASMNEAKSFHDALPADELTQFADFPPPVIFERASRLAIRAAANAQNPPMNLVISNVPGPREPLYVAGAKVRNYIPVSTITDGQGLNITVQSYCDTLDFGLVGCAQSVPDIDVLLDDIIAELEALAETVGIDVPVHLPTVMGPSTEPAAPKRAAGKKAAGKKRAAKKSAAKKATRKKTTKKAAAKKAQSGQD